jgi:hypothetical protein
MTTDSDILRRERPTLLQHATLHAAGIEYAMLDVYDVQGAGSESDEGMPLHTDPENARRVCATSNF